MNSRAGRVALIIVGIIATLTGAVWAGQGLNLIPGSVMTGDRTWLYVGLILVVIGIILLVVGLRRARSDRPGD